MLLHSVVSVRVEWHENVTIPVGRVGRDQQERGRTLSKKMHVTASEECLTDKPFRLDGLDDEVMVIPQDCAGDFHEWIPVSNHNFYGKTISTGRSDKLFQILFSVLLTGAIRVFEMQLPQQSVKLPRVLFPNTDHSQATIVLHCQADTASQTGLACSCRVDMNEDVPKTLLGSSPSGTSLLTLSKTTAGSMIVTKTEM